MSHSTTYKRTLSGSLGAGLGSIFSSTGRSYYILEHRVSSQYHHAGEAQEIIVDQAEIGRDSKCQVQFDESFRTVSRRHAAIVRDGENWKLVQLSQTNQTFLNGHPVANEWYLQNGDEIQLSVNGPKLGFIVPQGNRSKTGSIALTRRLSLFRQQALKPYKTAMAAMAVVIILLAAGGTWYGIEKDKEIAGLIERGKVTEEELAAARTAADEQRIASEEKMAKLEADLARSKRQLNDLKKNLEQLPSQGVGSGSVPSVKTGSSTGQTDLDACMPYVYFVVMRRLEMTFQGETKVVENLGSGTGFLLNDGRFITARHVVQPWMFPSSEDDKLDIVANIVSHNGGSVKLYLDAYSPTGDKMTFVSTNARVDASSDKAYKFDDGSCMLLPEDDSKDWASFQTNKRGNLVCNNTLSKQLPLQADLKILGYPMALGANSVDDISPIYSQAIVAKAGLDKGVILTTATTFEHGNSGGPVFATLENGEMYVVGIVSAGAGRSTGFIVPISVVK